MTFTAERSRGVGFGFGLGLAFLAIGMVLQRSVFGLEMPENKQHATRIAWAGERYADLADGTLDVGVGWQVYNVVLGWSDEGPEQERESYRRMAGKIAELTRNLEGTS